MDANGRSPKFRRKYGAEMERLVREMRSDPEDPRGRLSLQALDPSPSFSLFKRHLESGNIQSL